MVADYGSRDYTVVQPEVETEIPEAVSEIFDGTTSSKAVRLKRELGLFSAVSIILGVMIGSGIFISPTSALFYSGSVGMCLIVWIVCGLISLIGALAFAELGTVVPRSGAEYAYFVESYSELHPFWGPLPSFVCVWVYVVVLRPAEAAVIMLTFAEYTCQPLLQITGDISEKDSALLNKLVAFVALALITYINMTSVKLYVKIQNIFSSFKIIACVIIILGGIYELIIGNTANLSKGFEGTTTSATNIALAFYSGLWAYDGWTSSTTVTEEIKRPEVNIPRSIIISVPLVTALYVMMNVAYMTVLSVPEMVSAPAVAVAFGQRVFGPFSFIIPVGVALSTFGCALSLQFSVTRLCYVAGQEGQMIEAFSYVHIKKMTPAPAVAFQGLLSTLFIFSGSIIELIEFASFLVWIFYGFAMGSLLIMRRTKKHVHRPYKVPIWIPIFIIAVSIFLSVVPIATDPSPKFLIAVGFIVSGVFVYIPLIYYNKRPGFMDKLTYWIQVLFQVVPPNLRKSN